ncbi:hypothetical protein [Sinomonas sp.]|uniref:hypothetical protein n=1 Tax=Sinomonas sp. TaxID=1914986 RepID=UPI003F7F2213
MSGDKLPPEAIDCPRCQASRLNLGKRHCDSERCVWVKCQKCLATYDMHSGKSYHPDDYKEKNK